MPEVVQAQSQTNDIPQQQPVKRPPRFPNGSKLPVSKVAAVLAMDSMGVPKHEIARREHLSPTTVYCLVKQGDQGKTAVVDKIKKYLSAHWYVTAERGLNHITDEKLEKSSAAQLAVISSIATEKALLAEGKATQRIEFINAQDEELEAQIRQKEAELEAWKNGQILNAEALNEHSGSEPEKA